LIAGGAVAVLLWALRRVTPGTRRWIGAGVLLSGLAAVATAAAWPQLVFGALGREATLSGRIAIWQTVLAAIGERPLLGHGYAAFWRSAAAAPVAQTATNAHNGYLDLLAELGLAGGLLFAVPAVLYAAAGVRRAIDQASTIALWVPAYLGFFLVMNLAESTLLRHKIFWALYVAAVTRAAQPTRDSSPLGRRQRALGPRAGRPRSQGE
jgi:O-antigen ligase